MSTLITTFQFRVHLASLERSEAGRSDGTEIVVVEDRGSSSKTADDC